MIAPRYITIISPLYVYTDSERVDIVGVPKKIQLAAQVGSNNTFCSSHKRALLYIMKYVHILE